MTECKQEVLEFQVHGSRKVTADYSGGHLSSDGGGAFSRGVDLKMGLLERLAGRFSDDRLACLVEHKVAELLRQRIGALVRAMKTSTTTTGWARSAPCADRRQS